MIVLGVDPGSQGNCGWALLVDGGVRFAGTIPKDGLAIRDVLGLLPYPDILAIERPMGHFYNVSVALNRVVGRWLGLVEVQWRGVRVVEVQASQWQPAYVGPYKMPRTIEDPETHERRPLLDEEKRAAKASYEEAYRLHAVRLLGLHPEHKADAAAAAWVAVYATDHASEEPAPKRRKRR